MAHRDRAPLVPDLVERLGVSEDVVVWDEIGNVWDTGRRALLAARDSDWHLVIQDDVIVPPDLLDAVRILIERHPEHEGPYGFYMTQRVPDPRWLPGRLNRYVQHLKGKSKAALVRDWGPAWGPAVAVPSRDVEAIVASGDADPDVRYDTKIMHHYHGRGLRCLYPVPCFVSHRSEHDAPSVAHAGRFEATARRAPRWWVGADTEVAWLARDPTMQIRDCPGLEREPDVGPSPQGRRAAPPPP